MLKKITFWILCVGGVLHLACILILSTVPPISRDALIHHLVIPKLYLLHGGMYEIPSMFFSYFPMNLDLLYMIPLYFENDVVPKYIHFSFALLTAGFIYLYLKKALDRIYGLIGLLFFLSTPVIVKLSITVYVDLGLIFFSWVMLYYFLKWYDTDFRLRYLLVSGVFCGLALGTKYNGLILLPIMGVLVAMGFSLKKNGRLEKSETFKRNVNSLNGIKWGIVFLLVALIVFSPWMIRNAIWTQNPVHPLFDTLFSPPEAALGEEHKEKKDPQNAFWLRRHVYGESFLQTLLIPMRMFFQGKDDNPKYFDGKLSPFLFFLPIMGLIPIRNKNHAPKKAHKIIFFCFSVLFILFVLFQADFRIRYISPAIPPLTVLSVFGLANIMAASRQTGWRQKMIRGSGVAIISFAFLYTADYIRGQFADLRPMDYLSGKVDRDGYISRYRKEHPVTVYANQVLPPDAKVLCLSLGDRTYYLNRSAHLSKDFYTRKNGVYTESDILKKLRKYETTHVMIDKKVLFDWLRTLDAADAKPFLNVFQHHTKIMYEQNDVLLLEVIQP
ncbi:glycosyltransferase family 39 protein [Desulfosarcina sp. OttesenSCG-928-A07]|nr:glycosyltransferase family 39 protein [Desulfosarcina sp. OttesenSCG-928-A07]